MINPLLIPLFLAGAIFTLAGIIMLKFPPKEINSFYGYRTASSMKDQLSWNFAQVYSAKEMIKAGLFLMLFSLIGIWYKPGTLISITLMVAILIGVVSILFFRVERAITRNRETNS